MDGPTMRSFQLNDVREFVRPRSVPARHVTGRRAEEPPGAGESDRRRPPSRLVGRGRLELAIGLFSLLLALMAWRRDRAKSRQELLDGAVFVVLGALEWYLDRRNRTAR